MNQQEAIKEASKFFDHWPYCTVEIVESWLIKKGIKKAQIDHVIQTLIAHDDIFQWPDANCLARFNPSMGIRLDEYREFKEEYGYGCFDTFLDGEPAVSSFEKVHRHSWRLLKDSGGFIRICQCGKSVRAWKSMRKNLSNVLDAVSSLKQDGNTLTVDDVRAGVDSLGLKSKRGGWDIYATLITILRFRARLADEQFVIRSKILRDLVDVYQNRAKLKTWSRASRTRYKFVIDAFLCLPDLAA